VALVPNDDKQEFQEFEHTGDLGIELTAPTRVELFRRAAIALAALLVEKDTVAAIEERRLTVAGDSDADLMHDVLTTLVCLLTVDGFIWCDASVSEIGRGLVITLKGEPFDATRHSLRGEIKAVTYHELAVTNSARGWRARIILDV